MTDIRIAVRNTSPDGGTFLTPFWFGFHDGSFDVYDLGGEASPGLEAVAEDGSFDTIGAELTAADADAQGGVVAGAAGPIATGEVAATVVDVDGASNGSLGLVAMILPSNDAFVGTANALTIFDADGMFTGPRTVTFDGGSVRDAGTEVNTELDAAFINQTAPDTGETEDGVITVHPGFNGSVGNAAPEGDQIILGGTNAFGDFIDPEAADFTLPGSGIAEVHVNRAVTTEGTDGRDRIFGDTADDQVTAGGGNDLVQGRKGWDEIDGGAGNDKIFGNSGTDILSGGAGDDVVSGGRDADVLSGGAGDDTLRGGRGEDTFRFVEGDGADVIIGFGRGGDDDVLSIRVEGIDDFDALLATASRDRGGVTFDFGDGDSLLLTGTGLGRLDASDFDFG